MSQRAYYFNSITNFILEDDESVLGQLLINDEFETTDLQKMAWRSEIQILKEQLFEFSHGDIIFEYTIPRMGHRVDVICIIEGIIFLLEFKVGDKEYKKSTTDQVMDYALDLKYFHDKSRTRYLVPINVSTKAVEIQNEYYCMSDNIHNTLFCNEENIGSTIRESISRINDTPLSALEWINSRYAIICIHGKSGVLPVAKTGICSGITQVIKRHQILHFLTVYQIGRLQRIGCVIPA